MSKEYDEYLNKHIGAVRKATAWMFANLKSIRDMRPLDVYAFEEHVVFHDKSKWGDAEYEAYDSYFYGERDEDAFNLAWLHHIHKNPHHWQHWILMNDDGKCSDQDKVIALEMPMAYALEMVADWWSFSWRAGDLTTVFGWYEDHKDGMVLHPKTREFVEAVLGEIREALERGSGESE